MGLALVRTRVLAPGTRCVDDGPIGSDRFSEFSATIKALPEVSRDAVLTDGFLLERDGDLRVYYAPFDHVNESARLVLVGITPGWSQMQDAYLVAQESLRSGHGEAVALARAKSA